MEIVGYGGDQHSKPNFEKGRFLLMKDVKHLESPKGQGRVLDLSAKILYPFFNVHSILARGYWQEYTGKQDVLEGLLARVTVQDEW